MNHRLSLTALAGATTTVSVHFQSERTNLPGDELGSDQLLVNALLWAAKVLEPEAVKS